MKVLLGSQDAWEIVKKRLSDNKLEKDTMQEGESIMIEWIRLKEEKKLLF